MNDVDFPVAKVLEGIDAAAAAGLTPLKINMVVKRGVNEYVDRADGAALQGQRPHRPLHRIHGRRRDQRLADGRRRARPRDRRGRSTPRCRSRARTRTTPARSPSAGAIADGSGEIGVIASVTQAFCRDCTRARLSTDGKLYTCLFATDGHDLRALLRDGASTTPRSAMRSPRSGGRAPTAIRKSAPRTPARCRRSR